MNMPQAPQQQSQPQPHHPVSPTVTRKPSSSTPKPSKSTKSDAPSTKKTRTSVATQVLKTKSDKPANSDAVNSDTVNADPVNSEAASPPKQKRRRLVAAYDYEELEAPPATNPENIQTSPQTKPARFKRRANKAKRTRVPITEITDFTIEEEQAPSTTTPDDLSQALMVLPLQAVPISAATASSTSSEVDEEIICKEKATDEAETPVSDCNNPISDHGPSTPIPQSPMKIPEGAIVHDTAPENYKSDSLAKTGEEPSKSQSKAQEKSAQDTVEKIADPASDNDEDDESSDDDNNDNDNETSKSIDGPRTEVANIKETNDMEKKRTLLPLKDNVQKLVSAHESLDKRMTMIESTQERMSKQLEAIQSSLSLITSILIPDEDDVKKGERDLTEDLRTLFGEDI
ncbi:cell wall protein IFF6-like [Daucus carota subsp. sativus]|uniref:cell wall protein IFF6-like n=1 Tax=Daucus carota subsp. sativus TaxID=79200 RepID=UPI003082C277